MAKTYSLQDRWDKFQDKQVVIFWKRFQNGEIVPGLYVQDTGLWIQWLSKSQAEDCISAGVKVVNIQPIKRKYQWIDSKSLGI